MKIAVLKERQSGEARVAASPETVKKFIALGFEVSVEKGAGAGASFTDDAYREAGAKIATSAKTAAKDADVVLKVQPPTVKGANAELGNLKKGAILVGALNALTSREDVEAYAEAGVTAFAMELLPRITRAQSMDILSSQANLAGYRAVIEATYEYGRVFPMMMTAAGTVPPAKVLVMGCGVAGLQAIATAKRLGAVVLGYDVRPAVKEQVQSLGGKFLEVDPDALKEAETSGGYAKEMSEDYKKKEAAVIAEAVAKQDIIITTALIPGKPAPRLLSEDMVKSMKPGAVIVDLAAPNGGNCALTEPDKVVEKHGVRIIGHTNLASRLAESASALYAKNLLNFVTALVDKESKAIKIDWEDDIVKGTAVTRDGRIVHPQLTGEGS